MTKEFEIAFKEVLEIEGGVSNHVSDKGGLTKYGISQRSFPNEDIRNLTKERAKFLYYTFFWKTKYLNMDKLDIKISTELFDTAVNMGVRLAPIFLQQALNLMNRNQKDFPDLLVDGYAGEKTLVYYKKVNQSILLKVLNGLQFSRYVDICKKDPTQEVFFNGWMKRV